MSMLKNVLTSLGQDGGSDEATTVSTSLIGGKAAWRKKLEDEEKERQRLIAEAEAKAARQFSTYEVTDRQPKKILGVDVSGVLGDKYGYTHKMGITDKKTEIDPNDFSKQFDSMSKEAQKIYVSGVKSKVTGYEEDAMKKYEELKKAGKSDDEAKNEAAKLFDENYYAATNTIKTLEKQGKFKGNFMDFVEGSNDKLFGGLTRGAIRTGAFLTGGDADKTIKDLGQDGDGGEFTSWGKAGETAGSVQKGVVDVASLVIPGAGAQKIIQGMSFIDKAGKGGRLVQTLGTVAPHVAGSVTATGVGAVQDIAEGREQDLAKNAAIGTAVDIAIPVVGKLFRYTDAATGRTIEKMVTKDNVDELAEVSRSIKNIGENGLIGGLNKTVSEAGQGLSYKIGDMLGKTKAGSKIIDIKDDFMTKWVTEMHPLYKTLKRSDFEGKTEGAYLAAREAIGNSNRALSYAQDFIENDPGMRRLTDGIESRGPDLVKTRKEFDEFAKVKSDLDLAAAGKKEFSESKMKELNDRMAKFKDNGFDEEYDGLVTFYKDLNDFRLENGLISKEQYDQFADEGFDYIRQQRELPDWMLDKPAMKGRGSTASITKSEAVQKRSKYASAEQLSPMETAIKTAQLSHVEAYRNKAAKTVYGLLDKAGEAKLVRSTDLVREKQALLTALKESKPLVTKLNRTIRTNKNQAREISKEITQLRNKGKNELSKELNAFIKEFNEKAGKKADAALSVKATMEMLMSLDNKELRKVRRMLETRNSKLEPLLDKIELLGRELSDLHSMRSGIWNQAMATKTTVDKGGMTSLSFLEDGVENVAKIDPVVASAIHNWDKQQQNVMNEVLRFANNVFKYGTTGANAGFALPNFVADQVGSAINSKSIMSTHNPVNFVHSLFMTMGKPLNAKDAEIMRGFLSANKGQTTINQYTKRATADKTANKITRRNAKLGTKAYTLLRHPKEAARALFDATEGAVAITENVTRMQNYRGTYNKAIKEGMEDNAVRLANQAARENSVDFLEMGSYGRVINSLIPYFNAAIQGNRVMLRNAAERPVSFAAKTTALIGVPIAATTIWNTSDPDRKAIYDTIPDYVKETNYIVITPGAKWNEDKRKYDGVFLMKKPPGFKEFAEPVRKFIEFKADNGDSDMMDFLREQGGSVAADFAGTFTPIDFSNPNKFLSSVTPQLLKPTAEAILNKNFFQGEDIVGDWMSDLEPGDQKYENYSQLTAHIAGLFNTSPLKVDHWIRQTFGEVGTNAVNVIDRTSQAVGANPEGNVGGRSLPETIERRFYGAPGGADTDAFYKAYNPASSARTRASKEITKLVQDGRINEAKRRAEEYNESIDNRFKSFKESYSDSPNYDEDWDDRIEKLKIPITRQAFKARARQDDEDEEE